MDNFSELAHIQPIKYFQLEAIHKLFFENNAWIIPLDVLRKPKGVIIDFKVTQLRKFVQLLDEVYHDLTAFELDVVRRKVQFN